LQASATIIVQLRCLPSSGPADVRFISLPLSPAIFVEFGAAGEGSSWDSPLGSIDEALTLAAGEPAEIWVKEGSFRRTDGTPAVTLTPGIKLRGRFPREHVGMSATRSPPFIENTVQTRLLGGSGVELFAQHVVVMADDTVIDGFNIWNGRATEPEPACGGAACAGGILVGGAKRVVIEDVKFIFTTAESRNSDAMGGAVYVGAGGSASIRSAYFAIASATAATGYMALGGAVAVVGGTLSLDGTNGGSDFGFFGSTTAQGGNGGTSDRGGDAIGGAVGCSGGSLNITRFSFGGVSARGGDGAAGGIVAGKVRNGLPGGAARGAAIGMIGCAFSANGIFNSDSFSDGPIATGGRGGHGGASQLAGTQGGAGGVGGAAEGGAIYSSQNLSFSIAGNSLEGFELNGIARGGKGGNGGPSSGSAGKGGDARGGAFYVENAPGGVASAAAITFNGTVTAGLAGEAAAPTGSSASGGLAEGGCAFKVCQVDGTYVCATGSQVDSLSCELN